MSDVTRILQAIEEGDSRKADDLLPLVYDELRLLAAQKLAQEKPGQTLQATDRESILLILISLLEAPQTTFLHSMKL